jgi:hypothetical protein
MRYLYLLMQASHTVLYKKLTGALQTHAAEPLAGPAALQGALLI